MKQPLTLALDAAYGRAAVCLLIPGGRTLLAESGEGEPHSQAILPLFSTLLQQAGLSWPQLNLLAVGIGPGSYTGLRVAAATMVGINASLHLPMLAVSSLAVTAMQACSNEALWVIEDARAGDAYVGCYRQGVALRADACLRWQEVASLPPARFTALQKPASALPDWLYLPPHRSRAEALAGIVAKATAAAELASLPHFVQPAYIRPSQAETRVKHA